MNTTGGQETSGLTEEAIVDAVRKAFPEGVTIGGVAPRRIFARADRAIIYKLCEFLKNQLKFDHVSCVTGVDRIDRFQVVYHLSSYENRCVLEITVDIPRDDPEIDSISPLWGGANWHERETYDMFGIRFKNHPRLERIFLPEDTQFFPFRKDFKLGRQ